jgi:hypothetical protein
MASRIVPEHGTLQRYRYWTDPCRCDLCKAANAEASRENRRAARERGVVPEHGINGYSYYGCRCEICREANRVRLRPHWKRPRRSIPEPSPTDTSLDAALTISNGIDDLDDATLLALLERLGITEL